MATRAMNIHRLCSVVCCIALILAIFTAFGAKADPAPLIAQNNTPSEDVYWRKVRKWNSITGYRAYLKAFPDGLYVEDAQEKITKLERAESESVRKTENPSDAIAAPNKHIPGSFLTSPEIVRFIESHPAFAEAPPVRVRRLKLSQSYPNDPSFYSQISIAYDWLRPGLVKKRWYSRSPYGEGEISVIDTQYTAFLNGFFPVASNSNMATSSWGSSSRSKATFVEVTRGKLFPLAEGNDFAFRYKNASLDENGTSIWESHYEIRVARRLNANEIDDRFDGTAWELNVTYGFGSLGEPPSITRDKYFFVEMLGVWIHLEHTDPESPKSSWTATIDSFSM